MCNEKFLLTDQGQTIFALFILTLDEDSDAVQSWVTKPVVSHTLEMNQIIFTAGQLF